LLRTAATTTGSVSPDAVDAEAVDTADDTAPAPRPLLLQPAAGSPWSAAARASSSSSSTCAGGARLYVICGAYYRDL
jgi:hypothetical protein